VRHEPFVSVTKLLHLVNSDAFRTFKGRRVLTHTQTRAYAHTNTHTFPLPALLALTRGRLQAGLPSVLLSRAGTRGGGQAPAFPLSASLVSLATHISCARVGQAVARERPPRARFCMRGRCWRVGICTTASARRLLQGLHVDAHGLTMRLHMV